MQVEHNYKCKTEMHNKCENSAICHLCDGISLYKNSSEEKKAKWEQQDRNKEDEKNALLKTHKKEKKEGMAFEKRVASQWNNKFSKSNKKKVAKPRLDMMMDEEIEEPAEQRSVDKPSTTKGPLLPSNAQKKKYKAPEAQRQVNSGAFWHSKGDIKLEHALMECKERGSTNARGEKQITIPKLWLEKQEKEAFQENRPYWYIPFGYKNDESVYLVKPYDHEIEMIYEMREARKEIEKLQAKIDQLEGKDSEQLF
jgi:hypothetical protein